MTRDEARSDEPTWPDVDRRQSGAEDRKAFDRAVEKAAELAAQSIAQLHRRRLIGQAALITLLAALAVMLPVSFVLYENARSAAHANAVYDCHLFKRAADIMAGFIAQDSALRVAQQRSGLAPKIIQGLTKVIPIRTLTRAQANNTHALNVALVNWQAERVALSGLGASSCTRLAG